jgi:long-chain acyl-CoA synthetase
VASSCVLCHTHLPDSGAWREVAVGEGAANIADLVRRAAQDSPDKTALVYRREAITWADLDARVDAAARGLRALGLAAGDRVALALPNTPEFVAGYFGALRADLVALPANPGYAPPELRYLLTDSGARVLIGTGAALAGTADVDTVEHRFAVGADPDGARPFADLPVADGEPARPGRGGEDLAVLLYTSGTSGRPKGAMLSHRALLANLDQVAALDPPPVGPDDVLLLALPLFHAFGLGPGLHTVARHAATGVLVERFDESETLDLIADQRVTCVLGVPAMYAGWSLLPGYRERFGTVRLAVCGAAPLPAGTRDRLREAGVRLFEGYGLTETAPVVTSTLAAPAGAKPGSAGRPLPGVGLRLLAPDGEPLEPEDSEQDEYDSPGTDPGEIEVRGASLFSGYWPDGTGGPDADGWWRTADIGYVDSDGDLYLVDRIGDLILVSGFNVYPREVEDALARHPAVREAAVVGAPHPHSGQTVKAYVVAEPGATVSVADLIEHCERNLARFKCPTTIDFVPRLPHSATGKVRKVALP